jgi:glucokinase
MEYKSDKRIILTLDAGGTNFDFSAVRGGEIISKALLPAAANSLEEILKTIIMGFEDVKSQAGEMPSAISFCFPGPADFEKGIIGELENLPLFRGGVPLKAMLEEHFAIPVFINNDGDLFTYGEAIAGLLPDINTSLEASGIGRQYKNLLGVTFGTGFGGGMVYNSNQLYIGDNSAGFEINRMRNKLYPTTSAEDSVTIRAIRRVFAREAGISIDKAPEPKDIFKIGMGKLDGNEAAAKLAYTELAEVAGSALADAVTLTDSLIVIGGGLAGAWPLFMPRLVEEMNASFTELSGDKLDRLEISAFNLEDKNGFSDFMQDSTKKIPVPFSEKVVDYDPIKRIGVGISRLGTSEAVAIGAYSYALNELSQM